MTLSVGDLKMLAVKAKNENAWMNSCPSPNHRPAWLKAASEINAAGNTPKAVEDALARFVGTDNLREQIVRDTVRGKPGDVAAGAASEFPDSIVTWRKDYEDLVLAASEKQVAKAGESDKAKGFALAKDFLARPSSMSNNIRSASGFKETDVKDEMLSAIASRQSKIEIEIRKLSGVDQATAEKGQERADWERLLDACIVHQQDEKLLFDKIDAENKETFSGAEAARNILPLTIQIKNLHAIWKKEYERMAMLSQENGWGKDRYYKFKPDTARLDRRGQDLQRRRRLEAGGREEGLQAQPERDLRTSAARRSPRTSTSRTWINSRRSRPPQKAPMRLPNAWSTSCARCSRKRRTRPS